MKKLVINGKTYKFLYDFGEYSKPEGAYYENDLDPAWVILTTDGKLQRLFNGKVRDWDADYILIDDELDKEASKILKQSTGSGKYYAYSFDESRRIQKCLNEDIPIGRVALYPTESDEMPEDGWLVYQPWGMGGSCDSKKYNSYREAVEDFLDAQYTHWYERVNDL